MGPKQGLFSTLEQLGKSNWSTYKKVVKIIENFLKSAPRENPRSAPDYGPCPHFYVFTTRLHYYISMEITS